MGPHPDSTEPPERDSFVDALAELALVEAANALVSLADRCYVVALFIFVSLAHAKGQL